jgi:hypothetical protein
VVFEDFEKHLGEPIGGVGGKAFGIGEVTDRIKGPEDIGRAIDQIKVRTIRHKNFPRGKFKIRSTKSEIRNKFECPKSK